VIPGNLVINGGVTGTGAAVTMLNNAGQIATTSNVTLNGRATLTLAGQLTGDQIQLCILPPGATFAVGLITASVSLGSANFAVGVPGAATKYRGASPMTQVDWPNLFGAAAVAGAADALVAEEPIFGTISGANLPAAGTLVVDFFVSQAT
jgi:hypothetical protein